MGGYLSSLKIFIYYFFLKTVRGVKEWEHGSLLTLTHFFYFLLFIYYLERADQVNSLKAVSFSCLFLLFNLLFLIYFYFAFII